MSGMRGKPDVSSFIEGGAAQEGRNQGASPDRIVEIPLDHIVPQPGQDRDDWEAPETVAHIQSLADSMKLELPDGRKYGVRKPLEVLPVDADGKHALVSGESRWRGARIAGLDSVPCIIRSKATVENRLDHVTENAIRKGLTLWQQANSIRRDKEEFNFSSKQIMVAHGIKNKTQLSKINAVFSLPETAQELVKQNLVGDVNLIYDLKKLDETQLQKLRKKIEKGVSVPQAIKSLLPKPKKEKSANSEGEGAKVSESETPGAPQVVPTERLIIFTFSRDQVRALATLLDLDPELDSESLREAAQARLSELADEAQ